MNEPAPRASWIVIILAGALYVAISVYFGNRSGTADTHDGLIAWRRAAWIAAAIVFVAQMTLDITRGHTPKRTAMFAAMGAAAGAFGIAAAAIVHGIMNPSPDRTMALLWLALVIFPLAILPLAYFAGLAVAMMLKRVID